MSLFYESIGSLLGRAAGSLEPDDPGQPPDERRQRELRQVRTLLRRVGAIWPQIFPALERETAILAATLRAAAAEARAHGLAADDEVLTDSPLDRYRELLRALDEVVVQLQRRGDEPWAQEALRALRRGLADAAEVQGELVDGMLRTR